MAGVDPISIGAAAVGGIGSAINGIQANKIAKQQMQLDRDQLQRGNALEDEQRRNAFAQQMKKSPALGALMAQLAQRMGLYMPQGAFGGAKVLNPISYGGSYKPSDPRSDFYKNVTAQGGNQGIPQAGQAGFPPSGLPRGPMGQIAQQFGLGPGGPPRGGGGPLRPAPQQFPMAPPMGGGGGPPMGGPGQEQNPLQDLLQRSMGAY